MDLAFLVLMISIFASRFIQINAFRNLADEDKGKILSKSIMRLSQVSLLFIIVLVAAFYLLISKYPDNSTTITSSFFIALMVQRIVVYISTRKKMTESNVPFSYINKYFFSWLVTTIGIALFIVLFIWQLGNGIK
jgi:hypothetical protein